MTKQFESTIKCINCNKQMIDMSNMFGVTARNPYDATKTICHECMFTIIQDLQARTRSLPIPSCYMHDMADYRIWRVHQQDDFLALVIAADREQALETIYNVYKISKEKHLDAEEIDPILFVKGEEKECSHAYAFPLKEVKPSAIIGCLKKENII